MKNEKNPFLLNLGSLLPQPIGSSRQFPFDIEQVKFTDTFSLAAFKGALTASRTTQGLLAQGNFKGELTLQCVRCLQDYAHLLKWEITELYVFDPNEASDEDQLLPNNGKVDIEPILAEEAQLNIPINPICKNDCQGLCQICGTDLNKGDCGHKDPLEDDDPPSDSPFAKLKDLR